MRKDLVEKSSLSIKESKDLKVFEKGRADMTMLYSSSENDAPATRLFVEIPVDTTILCTYGSGRTATKIRKLLCDRLFKDTTTMLHDWYQKGYISQDAGKLTLENWRSKSMQGWKFIFTVFFLSSEHR